MQAAVAGRVRPGGVDDAKGAMLRLSKINDEVAATIETRNVLDGLEEVV